MSFYCVLKIDHSAVGRGNLETQDSPFWFKTKTEATAFGLVMFEPPRSVESWKVEESKDKPNYRYKNGKLVHLFTLTPNRNE